MMPERRGDDVPVFFLAACVLAVAGCGGRASGRAVIGAEPPPFTEWERPSRVAGAQPAVRLDGPDDRLPQEQGDTDEEDVSNLERAAPRGEPFRAGDLRIHLQAGMTLYSLARTYQVSLPTLMRRNGITDPTAIPAGTIIVVPDTSNRAASAPAPSGAPPPAVMSIAWPIDGRVTGGFGLRGRHHHHEGIDIDGFQGEEVRAVAAGTVVVSGSEKKYGKTVVIDHGNGVTTLYAHASRLLVREGDRVEQGEAIARVGATGNAHGTHLHFEVRRDGRPVDPSPCLRSGTVPLPTP